LLRVGPGRTKFFLKWIELQGGIMRGWILGFALATATLAVGCVDTNPSQTAYPLSTPPQKPPQQMSHDAETDYPRRPNTPGAVLERADEPKAPTGYAPRTVP
jgi:hypothetical protein